MLKMELFTKCLACGQLVKVEVDVLQNGSSEFDYSYSVGVDYECSCGHIVIDEEVK